MSSSTLLDFIDGLSNARSEEEAGEYLLSYYQNLGFLGGNIWFGTGSGDQNAVNSVTTYTKAFSEYQYRPDILERVELKRFVSNSKMPVRCGWDIERKLYNKDSIDYEFSAFSLDELTRRNAIIFPIKTYGLPGNSGVSVMSEAKFEMFDSMLDDKGEHLRQCATVAHTFMQVLRRKERKTDNAVALTEREKECLLWLSRGLRIKAIADKLNISETRVNQIFKQAQLRLKAKTREEALAKAVWKGVISP